MVLADCGLRLGELLNLKTTDINMNQQTMKVSGKTGERVVRFGSGTARALLKYLMFRDTCNGHTDILWITKRRYCIETLRSRNDFQASF